MGIKGLWEVVEPAAVEVPLLSLTLANRYCGTPPYKPYTIGVDVSVWFEQCQQQTWFRAHPQSGQNPALRAFIFRLARLACLPVHLVFCYDGKERPMVKRNKQVEMSDHWMVRPTQHILNAFNIPWLMAPGEAEAQLAHMNKTAVIDAVMTDDSDVFVFGAHTVLRNSSLTDSNAIKVYTTHAIKCQVTPHLHDEAFVVMALCCGGDYDKGLRGCGTTTALGLVRCGVGTQLQDVLMGTNGMPYEPSMFDKWRQVVHCHLTHDPTNTIGRCCPSVAASLSDSFPPPDIIKLYLEPAIMAKVDLPYIDVPRLPDLTALASLTQELLGWEDGVKTLQKFRALIWPAVVLKEVLMDLRTVSLHSNEIEQAGGCTRAVFLSFSGRPTERCGISGRVESIPTDVLVKETLAAPLMNSEDEKIPASIQLKLKVWMPRCLIDGWRNIVFLGRISAANEPALIDLTVDDPPISLGVIDLTDEAD